MQITGSSLVIHTVSWLQANSHCTNSSSQFHDRRPTDIHTHCNTLFYATQAVTSFPSRWFSWLDLFRSFLGFHLEHFITVVTGVSCSHVCSRCKILLWCKKQLTTWDSITTLSRYTTVQSWYLTKYCDFVQMNIFQKLIIISWTLKLIKDD